MNVYFAQSAKADIKEIHNHIARENPSIAASVISAIERATDRLSTFPLSGRNGAVETTRELVVPRLPFIVVYRKTPEAVEIIAVFHAAQDKPRSL